MTKLINFSILANEQLRAKLERAKIFGVIELRYESI